MHCAACGKIIVLQYVSALGGYYHPDCFVCTRCRAPFQPGGFTQKDGKPYCLRCYQELFLPRCAICAQPLAGTFVKNLWGEAYCKTHESEFEPCSSCQRPVCPTLTRGGTRYPDGRVMCQICLDTAVSEPKAVAAFYQVRRFLRQHGVDLGTVNIPLALVDKPRLAALRGSTPRQGAPLRRPDRVFGVTVKTTIALAGRTLRHQVNQIAILHGLPWEQFTAIAAHELGHAWLCLEGIDRLSPVIEEGFCELLGYLWLESLGTATAKVRMSMMENNLEPVYGEGLKRALKNYRNKKSLPAVVAQLRATKM